MGVQSDNHRVSTRELKWLRRAFWSLVSILGLAVLLMLVWLSVTTGNFLMVVDYRYNLQTQTFEMRRKVDVPWDIEATWITEAIGNGLECTESGKSVYEKYQSDAKGLIIGPDGKPVEKLLVHFRASDRLAPCMSDPNVTLVTQWSMRVWGPFYLRPIYRYIPPRG